MIGPVSAPIRVLHCINSLSGGGAERQLQLLANASCRHGILSGVFCVRDKGNELDASVVKVYKSQTDCKYNITLFHSLSEAIAQFKPDILHAWLPSSMTIPTMLLAARHHIPCVWSYRGAMFFKRPLGVIEYLLAWICAARIITNNSISCSSILHRILYRSKQGVEVRNAVMVNLKYRRLPLQNEGTFERAILFAGRITHIKNWSCLLKALPILLRTHKAKVIFCGDGEEQPQLKSMVAELGLGDYVSLLGYRRDIHDVMQRSDVLVLPSWSEGMSNVFLEALAIGLPCVVSAIPANLAIIGDTGCALTFPPSSPDKLAACLQEVLSSHDFEVALIRKGLAVSHKYSLDRMAKDHASVYRSLYAGSTKGNDRDLNNNAAGA